MATPQQIARLAAGAKGGTAGVAEFDQAQKQVAQSRDQAIGQMQHQASALMAPAALTAQLSNNLRTSSQGALSDLGEYSGAAANSDAQDQAGTANYLNEARAAIPLINSYSNLDLQQKLEMLAAQRARTSARAGGAAKPLSDAQLRTDLLGLAQVNRQGRATEAQQNYQADLAHLDAVAQGGPGGPNALAPDQILNTAPAIGPVGPQGVQGPPGTAYPNAPGPGGFLAALPGSWMGTPQAERGGSPAPPKLINGPATIQSNFKGELDQQAIARQNAVQKLLNDLHGPGITQEAISAGEQAGIDPNRLYGLLTPQVDRAYVNAQKAEGLYRDPNLISNTLLPLDAAAKAANIAPADATKAVQATFTEPRTSAPSPGTLSAWAAANTYNGQPISSLPVDAQKQLWQTHSGAQAPVVGTIIKRAHAGIVDGIDFNTFQAMVAGDPAYQGADPHAVALALAMVRPLFTYASSRTRTGAPAPTPASVG